MRMRVLGGGGNLLQCSCRVCLAASLQGSLGHPTHPILADDTWPQPLCSWCSSQWPTAGWLDLPLEVTLENWRLLWVAGTKTSRISQASLNTETFPAAVWEKRRLRVWFSGPHFLECQAHHAADALLQNHRSVAGAAGRRWFIQFFWFWGLPAGVLNFRRFLHCVQNNARVPFFPTSVTDIGLVCAQGLLLSSFHPLFPLYFFSLGPTCLLV